MALMDINDGVPEDKTEKSVSAPFFLLRVSIALRILDTTEASTISH
jgi:hypothetical protein